MRSPAAIIIIILALLTSRSGAQSGTICSDVITTGDFWERGWNGTLDIPVTRDLHGWDLEMKFTQKVELFGNYRGIVSSKDNLLFHVRNTDDVLQPGDRFTMTFFLRFPSGSDVPEVESVSLNGKPVCPIEKSTKYDYNEVLRKSLLFFEAQRSGKLPRDNRVPWRGDSCLDDRGKDGEDLSGGYYVNGGYVKYNFPMAAAATMLAWGIITHEKGYDLAGELDRAREALKWATDYLIKCHVAPQELYAQVGDPSYENDKFWGRPEDIDFKRPSFKITDQKPGSDLAAEVAAALAAASVVFSKTDHEYKALCLRHARQLQEFSVSSQGLYHDASPLAKNYRSSGYLDEITWANLWLYRATFNSQYLNDAEQLYKIFRLSKRSSEFSWDDKEAGIQVLLSQMTFDPKYVEAASRFCDHMIFNQTRTPKGLLYLGIETGTLRYAANVAFTCYELADLMDNPVEYRDFAVQQVNYILGDAGRSFMIGFGHNPPERPHHSASSCPSLPDVCDWEMLRQEGPNPHVLTGAIVGGPDRRDKYVDDREDYIHNEVGIDYNAAFTSLVAGLRELEEDEKLPERALKTVSVARTDRNRA